MSDIASRPAPSERELVDRFLRTRDEACFLALYRQHTPALLLLAQRLSGNAPADAEDAVQETWVRAMRALASFRWESALRTWLYAITVNCCRELTWRRGRSKGSEPVEELAGRAPSSHASLEVESLVRELPEGYRQVLVLHDVQGHTHDEIGQMLGITSGTSKSQLSRARRLLRAWLDGRPGKELP